MCLWRHFMRTGMRFIGAGAALFLFAAGVVVPAHAVYNIRNVEWRLLETSGTLPNARDIFLSFDAQLSASEVDHFVTSFSVALLTSEQEPWRVQRFTLGPIEDSPQPGTAAHVEIQLTLMCLAGTTLVTVEPESGVSRYTYTHSTEGPVQSTVGWNDGTLAPVRRFDTIVLCVLDESGVASDVVQPVGDLICALPEPATIGVYFDAQGTQCEGTIGPDEVAKVYIIAKFGPQNHAMAGADFRFAGVPTTWEVWPVPRADALALGDPFGDGVALAFPCSPQTSGSSVLYEVLVQAGEAQEDVVFSIEPRVRPRHPTALGCPIFVSCDPPRFSQSCLETERCFVNSTKPTPCATPVSVTQTTWGAVKEMFR